MSVMIQTTHLTKRYREVLAVDNLNLSVKQGEILGFLGLNGAGKTTTIRMLLGMIAPTSGHCYLEDRKVNQSNLDIWQDVGYIVEAPYSYPELTVRENLELVRRLRGIKDKDCVHWIINKLKLEEHALKKAKHLSQGNAQRLGIAKALIHKPKILLLDEPTNGLDPAGSVEIRELLLGLATKSGVTVLVSSHKLDEISKIATKIAIIHRGKQVIEMDIKQLEKQVRKSLIIDGRDRDSIKVVLTAAGYKVQNDIRTLQIHDEPAVHYPEKIATLLVHAGYPPTLLKVEKEDLESYFLRIIGEVEDKSNA